MALEAAGEEDLEVLFVVAVPVSSVNRARSSRSLQGDLDQVLDRSRSLLDRALGPHWA